jgi:hypothetical protein
VTFCGHFFQLAHLCVGVGNDLAIADFGVIFHASEVLSLRRVHSERTLVEVLVVHVLEREARDGSVWVLLALGQVSDQVRDVLFQLGQVKSDVVFVKLHFAVVLHVGGDHEEEVRLVEERHHILHKVGDVHHLLLNVFNLGLLLRDLRLHVVGLLVELLTDLLLVRGRHGAQLLVALDFLLDLLVLLLDHVNFAVEHIDVVEERDVLLLGLDEGRHDFLRRGDSSGFLDLLEGVLDDLDIADVHVHQVVLLFVVGLPLLKTAFQEGRWVGEFGAPGGNFVLCGQVLGASAVEVVVIALLQLLLQVHDAVLEGELVNLVLGFESQDLVVSLLRAARAGLGQVVQLLNGFDSVADLTIITSVDAVLDELLLAHDIDLFAGVLVGRLDVVVLDQGLVELVLEKLDLGLLLSHLGTAGSVLLETLLLFGQIDEVVLILVLQD